MTPQRKKMSPFADLGLVLPGDTCVVVTAQKQCKGFIQVCKKKCIQKNMVAEVLICKNKYEVLNMFQPSISSAENTHHIIIACPIGLGIAQIVTSFQKH